MDIQELNQFESVYQPSKEITFCWGVKKYVQLCLEQDHTDIVDHANDSLRIWQAAKAQAVPDGYVVVPKEPSANLVDHGHQVFLGHFNEGGQSGGRSLYFAYKAMIEAHRQDGDALCHHQWVDGLDGGTMVCANKCGAWK